MPKIPAFSIKNILFMLPMAIWVIAWLSINYMPLKGDVTLASNASFSWKEWWSGEYQRAKETYLNDNFGGRSIAVRLHNQLDYSLYGKLHAKDVVEGKNGYLYGKGYIDSYCGRSFAKEQAQVNDFISKATQVSSWLKAQHKDLILVIAPGKASFSPENIPSDIACASTTQTTYYYAKQKIQEQQLDCIDFVPYFIEQKNKQPYPLFTPYGVHWSLYGSAIAFDSLSRYIAQKRNIALPRLSIPKVEYTCQCGDNTDCDLRDGMNLLASSKLPLEHAIPQIEWKNQAVGNLNVLFVSDSFMWTWVHLYLPHNTFKYYSFWFYNNEYWDKEGKYGKVKDLDLKSAIQQADVIVLLGTEFHTNDMSYGFLGNVISTLKPN